MAAPAQAGRHVLMLALGVAYPVLVYWGLQWGSARVVAMVTLLFLLLRLRWRTQDGGLQTASSRQPVVDRWELAIVAVLCAASMVAAVRNEEWLIRLMPVGMNLGTLLVFARSLTAEQTLVERLARRTEPNLSAAGVRYTRAVTQVWCVFLSLNTMVSAWTALAASRELWALYNGLIAYGLMGLLFAGEWLVRQSFRARERL